MPLALHHQAFAQQDGNGASTADAIAATEREKAKHLVPLAPPHGESVYDGIQKHILDPISNPNGFSLKLGGLPTGGGFSIGPRYTRPDLLGDHLVSDTSVVGSTQEWWRGETSLATPHLFHDHLDLKTGAAYEDAASLFYFGEGPRSLKDNKTNFRREFTTASFAITTHSLGQRLTAGYTVGGLLVNVGPGNSNDEPSSEKLFTEANTPGLQTQSNFIRGTATVGLDLTKPGFSNPSGLSLEAADTQFWDRSGHNNSFHLLQTQATYAIPFWNGQRAFVLRARNETTFHDSGQQVPFYLQPTLGGPNDLRGVERYRFYGDGASVLSGEYRWSLSGAVELALFGDGGNVYQRPGLIGLRDLQGDGGFGVRVKNKQATVLRFDVGFSSEGVKVWFVFNDAFTKLYRSF
jgi:outer membrane protein assembly factor BamA